MKALEVYLIGYEIEMRSCDTIRLGGCIFPSPYLLVGNERLRASVLHTPPNLGHCTGRYAQDVHRWLQQALRFMDFRKLTITNINAANVSHSNPRGILDMNRH